MITPSYGLTATERVLPRLALDFTTTSLDPRVTFTRTTGASNPATYVNSSGVVTAATDNQPRFDYDPVTLYCKGLLIEEQRTNLETYSEDFLNTATAGSARPWVWSNASVSINPSGAPVTPANTLVANKLIENTSASTTHSLQRGFGLTSGTYTFSIYAKAAERSWIRLMNNTATGSNGSAYFNLSTGVVGTVGGGTAAITPAGNGWYRCSVSGTLTVANTAAVLLATGDNGQAYAGDGSSGVYIWGAQLEAGAFATSYIPTTSAALTRNADVATMTGTNFSSWYNQSEGTLFGQGIRQSTTNECAIMALTDGTNSIELFGASTNSSAGFYVLNGTAQANIHIASQFPANTVVKLAGGYKTDNFNLGANAVLGTKDTSGSLPTATSARIGSYSAGTGNFRGWIQKIEYYPQRLTDSELQAITK